MRADVRLAPYAVYLGFTLKAEGFDAKGCPPNGLQFVKGDVTVWDTARGWRVARLIDGFYEKPTDASFFKDLKKALDHAVTLGVSDA